MFLICFLSVTGFTGFKTHAEKFCRFHSLLFPPQRAGGILKYSCCRPAWSSQTLPQVVPSDAEEGLNNLGQSWELEAPRPVQPVPQQCSSTRQMPCQGNTASRKQKIVIIYSKSVWQLIVQGFVAVLLQFC